MAITKQTQTYSVHIIKNIENYYFFSISLRLLNRFI